MYPLHAPEISVWRIYTLEVSRELPSNDTASLYDLTLSEGWVDFDEDTTEYTVYVKRDVESVVITPIPWHPQASVTVNGSAPANAVALNEGGNVIPIVVTAQDGATTQAYEVTVYRGATNDYSAFIEQIRSGGTILSGRATGGTGSAGTGRCWLSGSLRARRGRIHRRP